MNLFWRTGSSRTRDHRIKSGLVGQFDMRLRTLKPHTNFINIIIVSLTLTLSIDFRLQKRTFFTHWWNVQMFTFPSNSRSSFMLFSQQLTVQKGTTSCWKFAKFLLERGWLILLMKTAFYDICFFVLAAVYLFDVHGGRGWQYMDSSDSQSQTTCSKFSAPELCRKSAADLHKAESYY